MGGIMNKRQEEIAELKRRIEALEKEEVKQWEPEGGEWFIDYCGAVDRFKSIDSTRMFGLERTTKEQAEKARDKIRVFNWLLAFHDEFCPDFEHTQNEENWSIVYDDNREEYLAVCYRNWNQIVGIYFPEHIAKDLRNKLNSGKVVL
jgi:hypothetical protein